jgi:hypothetical protein
MVKYGLFSPYTLRFHSDLYHEPKSALLKRSIILFDEMAYIARDIEENFINEIIYSETTENVKKVIELFKPIADFVGQDYMDSLRLRVRPESNLRYGPNGQEFAEYIRGFVTRHFGFDAYNVKNAYEFDILDFYVSALSSDFDYLFHLSNYNTDFSALFTELHRDAYFATYRDQTNIPERILEKVCSINYFDFGKLSWHQILELKQSHFLKDFRVKFFGWLDDFNQTQDLAVFEKNIDQYIKSSTFDFLKANQPAVGTDIATGILGNIPTPFPNPVSIYASAMTVRKDIKLRKEFGWLFFIQEAFHKYTGNK